MLANEILKAARLDLSKASVSLRLKKAIDRYPTQRAAAKAMGISEQYLSDMLLGRREWSASLLNHVGVERYVAYRDKVKV